MTGSSRYVSGRRIFKPEEMCSHYTAGWINQVNLCLIASFHLSWKHHILCLGLSLCVVTQVLLPYISIHIVSLFVIFWNINDICIFDLGLPIIKGNFNPLQLKDKGYTCSIYRGRRKQVNERCLVTNWQLLKRKSDPERRSRRDSQNTEETFETFFIYS